VSCVQFLIQGVGLVIAVSSAQIHLVYLGFFFYGIGLAGSFIIREVVWANFFGRASLGTVRGVSLFFSHLFAASGAPFFGFLFDATGSYHLFDFDITGSPAEKSESGVNARNVSGENYLTMVAGVNEDRTIQELSVRFLPREL
jgi:hypothetical protein